MVTLETLSWLVESGKGWFPGWLVGSGNHAVTSAVRQAEAGAARAIESSVSRFPENTCSTVIGLAALSWCLARMAARWPVIGMSTLSWIDQALDNLILAHILKSQRPGMWSKYTGPYTADFWELYTDLLPAFFARGSCPTTPHQKVAQTRESRKAHEAGAHSTGGGSRAIPRSARAREKAGTNSQTSGPYRIFYKNTRLAKILKSQRPSIYI